MTEKNKSIVIAEAISVINTLRVSPLFQSGNIPNVLNGISSLLKSNKFHVLDMRMDMNRTLIELVKYIDLNMLIPSDEIRYEYYRRKLWVIVAGINAKYPNRIDLLIDIM